MRSFGTSASASRAELVASANTLTEQLSDTAPPLAGRWREPPIGRSTASQRLCKKPSSPGLVVTNPSDHEIKLRPVLFDKCVRQILIGLSVLLVELALSSTF